MLPSLDERVLRLADFDRKAMQFRIGSGGLRSDLPELFLSLRVQPGFASCGLRVDSFEHRLSPGDFDGQFCGFECAERSELADGGDQGSL